MPTLKIAIDGPAGAGKSTVAKKIAEKMKIVYIDTGAMYRAVGLAAVSAGIDPKNKEAVKGILCDIKIEIAHGDDGQLIYLNGRDVTKEIRTPEISVAASDVAVIGEVREKLVELQRRLAEKTDVVMDGRDIGTYVLPDADVKIFLTASADERARRRYAELAGKGEKCSLEEVKRDMEYRDKNDSGRSIAPLKPAEDSILADTTGKTLDESVDMILELVRKQV